MLHLQCQEFPPSCRTPKASGPTRACVSALVVPPRCLLTSSSSPVVSGYLISFTSWKFRRFPNSSVYPPESLTIFCLNVSHFTKPLLLQSEIIQMSLWSDRRTETPNKPHCFHKAFLASLLNPHENPQLEQPPRRAVLLLLGCTKPVGAAPPVYHLECSKKRQFSAVLLDSAEMSRFKTSVPFSSSSFGICCANSWSCRGTVYRKEKTTLICLGSLWPGVFIFEERRKWKMEMLTEEVSVFQVMCCTYPRILWFTSLRFHFSKDVLYKKIVVLFLCLDSKTFCRDFVITSLSLFS